MLRLHVLCIGRLKTPFWQEAAAHYRRALARHLSLEERVLKDAPGALPPDRRRTEESARLLHALERLKGPSWTLCLDEGGQAWTSRDLARFFADRALDGQTPVFVVGGAFGLTPEVPRVCRTTLALSALTLPHALARVLLLEQCYRAATILAGLPYHHD
jgi:23S rRNA (pseudouridine1915-N3)-methyltransferase